MGTNKDARPSIIFYTEWARVLKSIPQELRFAIFDALINYIADGTLPNEDSVKYSAFACFIERINQDQQSYMETCRARAESGKKGARAQKGKK